MHGSLHAKFIACLTSCCIGSWGAFLSTHGWSCWHCSDGLSVKPQVDTGAQLLAMLYLVLQFAVPQLFAGAATGPLLLPAAATAAAALLRVFDPAR